jgi:hypothetical protein
MSATPQELPTDAASPRTANGRFAPGNSGGPGNPFGRQVAELRKVILQAVSSDRLRILVDALIDRAIEGDNVAAKLVLQYALGKPAAPVEPDRVAVDEFRLRQDAAITDGTLLSMLMATEVNVVNEIVDTHMATKAQNRTRAFAETPTADTPAGRRAARKAKKRLSRTGAAAPSPNGIHGQGSKARVDKHGLPFDRAFGPDRAG